MARNRWLLPLLGAFALSLLLLATLLAARVADVSRDLRTARAAVHEAGALLAAGEIDAAHGSLAQASALLVRANRDLYRGPDVAVLGVLPGVAHNLAALRETAALALRLADGGRRTLEAAAPLEAGGDLDVPLVGGSVPLATISGVQAELERLLAAMPASAPRPRSLLLGSVRELRATVYEEARGREEQVATLSRGLGLLAEMAGSAGPRRYLVAVAGPSGDGGRDAGIVGYGVLQAREGRFGWSRLQQPGAQAADATREAPAPADRSLDAAARDGSARLDLPRGAGRGDDFATVARELEEAFEAATGDPVDGVIQVDAAGLAAIIHGIGPVPVPGLGPVGAADVEALPVEAGSTSRLAVVADAVFAQLASGRYSTLRPLGGALLRAAAGHHVLAHAKGAAPQADLRFFGATGESAPSSTP